MRPVVAAFVFSIAALPLMHAQGIGAVVGSVGSGSYRPNQLHQTNNPVTLVLEMKTVQTLTDGTHITRTDKETFIRDTLGRTRSEHTSEGLPPGTSLHAVNVDDVVAGRSFNWVEAPGMTSKEYSVREDRPVHPIARLLPPPAGASVTQTVGQTHIVADVSAHPVMPKPQEEDLGMKDIQGVTCKASRITTTYPEGFWGNDRPITVTEERCFSQEFQRNLEETRVDPRSGTTTTTLTALTRGEPDPSLFHPPADYAERPQVPNR